MENLLSVYLTSYLIIYPPKGSQKLPEQVIRLAKVCRVCNKPGTGESFSISLTQPLSVPRVLNCRIITPPSLREHSEGQSIAIVILFIKSIVKVLILPWENVLKHSLFPRQ